MDVSFLDLWKGPVKGPQPRRRIGAPPIALICALLAMLLGILAAARPGITAATGGEEQIAVVVDRGITMSMGKPERFKVLLDEVTKEVGARRMRVLYVPDGEGVATALDTRGMVQAAVRKEVERGEFVILISDESTEDSRVVPVRPMGEVANISIARVAARIGPVGQVMVGVRNHS